MPAEDPLTPEEQDVRDLLADPERLHAFAAAARQRWERTPAGKAAVARCRASVGGFREPGKEQR
jgi:hypothetical protein